MAKTEFQSTKDLKKALRAVVEFAEDATFARLFETTSHGESNLFHLDNGRIDKLARIVDPDLNEDPDPETRYKTLPNDAEDRLRNLVNDTRRAFFTIGLFLGACIADPSGKALDRLGEGWMRATLAQPRHRHLQPKPKA